MTGIPFDRAKAEALAAFTDQSPAHINCAQAMVHFTLDVLGKDRDIMTAARYFGGGVSGMGGTCGAVSGTAMALGLRDLYAAPTTSESVASTHDALKGLIRSFEKEFGACTCRQLTDQDLSTPAGMDAFKASEARDRCPVYIAWMCDHLFPLLGASQATDSSTTAQAGGGLA